MPLQQLDRRSITTMKIVFTCTALLLIQVGLPVLAAPPQHGTISRDLGYSKLTPTLDGLLPDSKRQTRDADVSDFQVAEEDYNEAEVQGNKEDTDFPAYEVPLGEITEAEAEGGNKDTGIYDSVDSEVGEEGSSEAEVSEDNMETDSDLKISEVTEEDSSEFDVEEEYPEYPDFKMISTVIEDTTTTTTTARPRSVKRRNNNSNNNDNNTIGVDRFSAKQAQCPS